MKKITLMLVTVILLLAGVLLFNTWRLTPSNQTQAEQLVRDIDSQSVAEHLAKAISYRTISTQADDPDFAAFRTWLANAYPNVHATMNVQTLGGGTLLYHWAGSDGTAKPILLTGHYDVVPVNPGTLDQWTHSPFVGTVADGNIWGRGALDNKSAVIAMLEAAEALIAKGFQPRQTLYFSFGHDAEIGGDAGAAAVVRYFQDENIQLAWSLDEGSYILDDIFPGLEQPVASINIAEKGFVTLLVTVMNDRISPASAVASDQSEGYQVIAQSLRDAFGQIIVLPGLTIAGTDSKHYSKVADDAYRINPFVITVADTARFHGIDERISVKNMEQGVLAFMLLIERL